MKYGYARVSGLAQDLDQQKDQLKQQGIEDKNIYSEKFTGTKKSRPELDKLVSKLKAGDDIYFTKVDRIGRNVRVTIDIVDELMEKGVRVHILTLPGVLSKDDPTSKLTYGILNQFAQFERDMIVTRLKEGKEYAKKHNPNYREGRPRRRITPKYQAVYIYRQDHSIRETAAAFDISESTVKRICKQVRESDRPQDKRLRDKAEKEIKGKYGERAAADKAE